MNLRFIKTLFILFLITTIFFYPVCSKADDLDKNIENIVKDFEQKIGDVETEKDYFIVVRSFFDKHTKKPSKLSEEIDDIIFQIIIDKYLGKKILVIFNWKSTKPLEKKATVNVQEVYYKQGIWQKKLVENFGKGFLVTGATEAVAEFVEINAELIDMATGKVLTSSKATIKGDTYEIGHAEKTQPTQQLAAVEAAPAIIATPSDKKKESEALKRDLQYKVIEDANFKYEGYIKNGKKHGQGTITFKSGDKYVGEWQNDKKHGKGTYFYSSGDKYVGEWENSSMHGMGTYFFKSGNKFEGQWQNDKKQGRGTYHFKNGDKWEGSYVNNKKHGRGVYTWATGESKEELWKDGKLIQ